MKWYRNNNRSNKLIWIINKIKEKYSEKFSEDLEENIKNNIKDENIQNLILILLNSEKDDNKEFNIEESKNQAKELFEAEDEEITEIFYNIIKNSSQKELSIIVREFHKISNKMKLIMKKKKKKLKMKITILIIMKNLHLKLKKN